MAFADANARFLAYDVLTFLSGIAGALLIAGAFTRWMWPLGAVLIVWFSASIVLGRLYPEAIQRLSVDPNTYAQEQPYIANNIAMTRLAFGLDQWDALNYGGEQPLTREAIVRARPTRSRTRACGTTAAPDDPRPAPDRAPVLRLLRRRHGPLHHRRHAAPGDAVGPRAGDRRNTDADNWVNQRIVYTHGIGVAMVPVNEVTGEGQPTLWIRDLPPVSNSGAPEVTQPRIYFGEADGHYVIVRAAQQEFDFPRNSSAGIPDETTSWTGQTGIPLDSTLSRLLFALRFRDFDLLITNQVQSDSQLLFHRTLSERLGHDRPVPASSTRTPTWWSTTATSSTSRTRTP